MALRLTDKIMVVGTLHEAKFLYLPSMKNLMSYYLESSFDQATIVRNRSYEYHRL